MSQMCKIRIAEVLLDNAQLIVIMLLICLRKDCLGNYNFIVGLTMCSFHRTRCSLNVPERSEEFEHAFARLLIRQSAKTCAQVVQQVSGVCRLGDDAVNGRMAEYEFQRELSPAVAVELGGPRW